MTNVTIGKQKHTLAQYMGYEITNCVGAPKKRTMLKDPYERSHWAEVGVYQGEHAIGGYLGCIEELGCMRERA